jgi:molecular chaperone GrpE
VSRTRAARRASRRPNAHQTEERVDTEATEGTPDLDGEGLDADQLTAALSEAVAALPESEAAESHRARARFAAAQLAKVTAAYRQLKDENDEFRQRMTRNIQRGYDERRERLLKFVEILDNLDRALEAAERSYVTEPLIEGLILVRSQLLQTLQAEGLERVPVLGLAYDPNIAEAVQTEPVDDPEHHHVVLKELLRSYRFDGRVIRAGHVVVGQHPDPPAAAPPEQPVPDAEARQDEQELEASVEEIIARSRAQHSLLPDPATVEVDPEPDENE